MKKPSLRTLAATLVLAAAAGCSSSGQADAPPTKAPHDPATMATPAAISGDPYEAAIAQFHQLGLKVWADSDLVGRFLDGPASFHEALARDAHLAGLPGVVGVKVADELGYNDGLDTPQQVQRFLDATAKGLHALAPHTKILVDMVVPDMGCLPWLASRLPQAGQCAQDERNAYPAASMDAVDGYLASGDIDQLDLSTGLRDPDEYASWGISVEQAQREAWTEAHRRGWQDETTLQARHAMAHPGDYPGGPATAWAEVNTYVRIPAEEGAADVQVWAWRQEYDGQTVRLMNPGLRPNPLWQALLAARRMGVSMSTTFTPSAMEVSLPADAHMIAQVFTGVYVAAGTG